MDTLETIANDVEINNEVEKSTEQVQTIAPQINEDAITDKAVSKVIERLAGGKTDEQKQQIKDYLKDVSFVKEGRNPKDWVEVLEQATDAALRKMEIAQAEKEKAKQEEEKKQAEVVSQQEKQVKEYWFGQFESLEKAGKMPQVPTEIQTKLRKGEALTEEEKDHPAVKARYELYMAAIENKYDDIKHAYYEVYEPLKQGKKTAMNAPVSMGKSSRTPSGKDSDFFYEDIHNSDYGDLMAHK